ncbi:hypothetical protein QJS10_CPB13g01527 [Acorus calamus]|uniref:Uncharacterized protein n=1 Tax=Acorus calamus TaxID=4465 RepID=A0AAV9DI33_ACOCL|nr:hypothetical protein QJS10_CPB13g01527 [Acorus calamus]
MPTTRTAPSRITSIISSSSSSASPSPTPTPLVPSPASWSSISLTSTPLKDLHSSSLTEMLREYESTSEGTSPREPRPSDQDPKPEAVSRREVSRGDDRGGEDNSEGTPSGVK